MCSSTEKRVKLLQNGGHLNTLANFV